MTALLAPPHPTPAALIEFCPSHSYGMRFIAKVLKDSLHEKFPDAGEDELLKVRIWTLAHPCPPVAL